ncbi:MAG: N-succinylglutamate 5-semialdehyde dehydrogenase [Phycisphaerales bacterium]|nr:N-succinylglutamate 5-semialdehyde dehydrogenase [Phycisphaerales bacterium]
MPVAPSHPSLRHGPANLIAGFWKDLAGKTIRTHNPANPSVIIWQGSPPVDAVADAVNAARSALALWRRWEPQRRFAVLRTYQKICHARAKDIAGLIADETGKVLWDAEQEASLLAAKVDITLDQSPVGAMHRVMPYEVTVSPTRQGRAWFRPHGVMAVIGPYNFPLHLPNGHIIPALATGNTVVFKPSDKAPACGQLLAELLQEALDEHHAPAGTLNLVHGAADVASATVSHPGIDGVLFTGSWPVGRKILHANLDRPSRIVALEMGGNNPAVVMDDADLKQAVVECARSAFISTGQRCTCTRRIIVHRAIAPAFTSALCKAAGSLIIGDPRADHPVFMGPIITDAARQAVFEFQTALHRAGAEVLFPSRPVDSPGNGWFLTPGVVRVERFHNGGSGPVSGCEFDAGCDIEVFGPLVRLCVVETLDHAIEQANATKYGLAAAIFSRSQETVERFQAEARAGCVNVNCGTAGASSKLPFGGLGLSGNHRPAGAFSLDYCAYPVAGMVETGTDAAIPVGLKIEDSWLS